MKLNLIIICCVLLCCCGQSFDYVVINGSSEYEAEIAFLESLFNNEEITSLGFRLLPSDGADSNQNKLQPSIYIDFFSSWEQEISSGEIVISRQFIIPRDDALARRTNTTLEACLNGSETLIKINELEPPFVALRVDGLTIGDIDYPLIRAAGIRIRINYGKETDKTIAKRFSQLEEALKNAQKPLVQQIPQPIWIAAGGDMMLERGASEILFREGPTGIFGGTAKLLASSDISMVNLEGAISALGERVRKTFTFRFVPETAQALKNAGINVVLFANNHSFDYGEEAFLDSLSWLNKVGIGIVGAGVDIESASDPFIFEKDGDTVRVFGLASFPREQNGWDGVTAAAGEGRPGMLHVGRRGAEMLKQKFSPDSLNIVFFHGGVEWSIRPDAATRELYTDLIISGADLIIGTHPHVVQGFEWVHGKPVFWSIGNYVFGGMNHLEGGADGLFLHLGFWRGKLLYMEPYPIFLNNIRTDIVSRDRLDLFYSRSRELRR